MAPLHVTDRYGAQWDLYMVRAEAQDLTGADGTVRTYEWTWVGLRPGTPPVREAFQDAIAGHHSVMLRYPTPYASHLQADLGHADWAGPTALLVRPFVAGTESWRAIMDATIVLADDLIAEDDGQRFAVPR